MKTLLKQSKFSVFNNKPFLIILVISLAVVIGFLVLQAYAEYKISNSITEQLPKGVELDYKAIDFNLLFRTIDLEKIEIRLRNNGKSASLTDISIAQLTISGMDYWSLWKEKRLKANAFYVHKISLQRKKSNSDTANLLITNADLKLKGFETNSILLKQKIPFAYKKIATTMDGFSFKLSAFELLEVNKLSLKDGSLSTGSITILSYYNKLELSKKLKFERDHVRLTIDNSTAKDFTLKSVNDSLKVSADKFTFNQTKLSLYRDKLLANNTTYKPLHRVMLRALPLKLDIKSVLLTGPYISYAENVSKLREPIPLSFNKYEVRINNLSNSNSKKTHIEAKALLMGDAPLQINFSFNANKTNDRFQASSTLKNLEASSINPFLESNAKVRAKGRIDELYFTISGGALKSFGDMKMRYKNFTFSLLDEGGSGVKKTLSTIANLLQITALRQMLMVTAMDPLR